MKYTELYNTKYKKDLGFIIIYLCLFCAQKSVAKVIITKTLLIRRIWLKIMFAK